MQVSPDSFLPPWMDMSPIEGAEVPIPPPSTDTLPIKKEDASPSSFWQVIYRPPENSSTLLPKEPIKASKNPPPHPNITVNPLNDQNVPPPEPMMFDMEL